MPRRTLRDDARERDALLGFLEANPTVRYRAAELKLRTGVPKGRVRSLLKTEPGRVTIVEEGGAFYYQATQAGAARGKE